jgi:hypothetical protein
MFPIESVHSAVIVPLLFRIVTHAHKALSSLNLRRFVFSGFSAGFPSRFLKDSDCRVLKILLSPAFTIAILIDGTTELGNRPARMPDDEHGV